MKNKAKKYFDSVQMVREIRDAMFKQATNPDFDVKEFQHIKQKWARLLELQQKSKENSKSSTRSIPDKDTTKFIDVDKPLNLEQILARDKNKTRVKKKRAVSR